jgi:hypothetical protein
MIEPTCTTVPTARVLWNLLITYLSKPFRSYSRTLTVGIIIWAMDPSTTVDCHNSRGLASVVMGTVNCGKPKE